MRRLGVLAGLVLIVATGIAAFAATLTTDADNLGSNSAVVARCHTGAVTVQYIQSVAGGPVTGLTASGLAGTCNGGKLYAAVTDSTDGNVATSSTPGTVTSGSATVTFSSSPAAEVVKRFRIVVVGP